MDKEIDEVILKLKGKLEELDSNTLEQYKQSLISEISKPDTNLKERTNSVWVEITNMSYDYERTERLKEVIKTIQTKDLLTLFNQIFFTNVNKLSIQVKIYFLFI